MIFEKLVALIAEQFNVDEDSITMDTSFVDDLNADSVDLMDLSVALEEEFGIEEMGDEDVSSIVAVGDVVKRNQQIGTIGIGVDHKGIMSAYMQFMIINTESSTPMNVMDCFKK